MQDIEFVNQKLSEALDEYETAVRLSNDDVESHILIAEALMLIDAYVALYVFGEMPISLMIRCYGVMMYEFKEELEIIGFFFT